MAQTIQDLVAPDVRELKTLVLALQKQVDQRFNAAEQLHEAQAQEADAQFNALMATFSEFKAQSELASICVVSQLGEHVAVLEASRSSH